MLSDFFKNFWDPKKGFYLKARIDRFGQTLGYNSGCFTTVPARNDSRPPFGRTANRISRASPITRPSRSEFYFTLTLVDVATGWTERERPPESCQSLGQGGAGGHPGEPAAILLFISRRVRLTSQMSGSNFSHLLLCSSL